MVLEATVVCIDNSDYMRNGDFPPTRFESQSDAVNLVCGTKIRDNAENSVAALTTAGNRDVLTTLTTDLGKILSAMHRVNIGGEADFLAALQKAQLVLKYRQSKNHRQRIVIFVASPIKSTEKELTKVAAKMKKNNISVDVINFGEEESNTSKLEAFISAVNKDDTSHLLTVPSGANILSDSLISSPIIAGEGGNGGGGGGGNFSEYGGVDPSLDPELALALRVSMEEERQRQERAAAEAGGSGAGASATNESAPAAATMAAADDSDLQAAVALSMKGMDTGADNEQASAAERDVSELTEEEQILRAMQLSMGGGASGDAGGDAAPAAMAEDDNSAADQDFLRGVLGSLEGVDADAVLGSLQGNDEKKDEDKKDKK